MINVSTWTELAAIASGLSDDYQLTRNLLSSDKDYIGIGNSWTPISTFTGTFNGQGYDIEALTIISAGNQNALFGVTSGATISNVSLSSVYITGLDQSGAIAGVLDASSSITNCWASGTIIGNNSCGGLVGTCSNSSITNSFSEVVISGAQAIGGLVGDTLHGILTNCWAVGNVTAGTNGGGLVGQLAGLITEVVNCGWLYSGFATSAITSFYDTTLDTYTYNLSVTYNRNDKTWFYDKTKALYTTSPAWDFATPVWYDRVTGFPRLKVANPRRMKGPFPTFYRTTT